MLVPLAVLVLVEQFYDLRDAHCFDLSQFRERHFRPMFSIPMAKHRQFLQVLLALPLIVSIPCQIFATR